MQQAPLLRLQPLLHPTHEEIAAVQRTMEAAPRYWTLTSGAPYEEGAAQEIFKALPPGKGYEDKFVFGVMLDDRMIGCIDLIRGWPVPETAMLGLLLLAESHQGKGLGLQAYRLIEDHARTWPAMKKIRIGVIAVNNTALRFWRSLGFAENGERKPHHEGSVVSEVIVFEKLLT